MRGRTLLGPFHTDANHPRERSRSSFGLSVHTHANVRANCSCEQFASFTKCNSREQLANEANFPLIRSHISFYYKNWNCIKSIHTDSGRSVVVSKIKTLRRPEQWTFLDFRKPMHTFTNRCSSASNSLIKFRRSPYFSFRVGLCV